MKTREISADFGFWEGGQNPGDSGVIDWLAAAPLAAFRALHNVSYSDITPCAGRVFRGLREWVEKRPSRRGPPKGGADHPRGMRRKVWIESL